MSDTASSGAMRMASLIICIEGKRVETTGLLAVVDGEYRCEPLHPATGVVRWLSGFDVVEQNEPGTAPRRRR